MEGEKQMKWKMFEDEMPTGKFVALYKDGSGAELYVVVLDSEKTEDMKNYAFCDGNGDYYTMDDVLQSHELWCAVPNDHYFHWEQL